MRSNPSKGAALRTTIASSVATILLLVAAGACAHAQAEWKQIAVKDGESIELQTVYWVLNCRSTLVALPEVEILQGPPQVTLSINEAQVVPRRHGCAAAVPGARLTLTAKGISEPIETKLTYRLNYKTRDGIRHLSHNYIVSLFP